MSVPVETHSREAWRQQQLLLALWRRADEPSLAPWLREPPARVQAGIAAYRGNAAAIAERALAAAYPTVQQLLGDESFAALARALWHSQPPQCGDLARFGAGLADWIAGDVQLAAEPYVADVARIDWAVHGIEQAADVEHPPPGLALLGELDPAQLRLRLRPGLALVPSKWPVAAIWQAHRRDEADRFAPVREAFARGEAQTAVVGRVGWRALVEAIDAASRSFMTALQQGVDLAAALDAAGPALAFDRWLQAALTQRWLQGVETVPAA